jgi:hypothetical protein
MIGFRPAFVSQPGDEVALVRKWSEHPHVGVRKSRGFQPGGDRPAALVVFPDGVVLISINSSRISRARASYSAGLR